MDNRRDPENGGILTILTISFNPSYIASNASPHKSASQYNGQFMARQLRANTSTSEFKGMATA